MPDQEQRIAQTIHDLYVEPAAEINTQNTKVDPETDIADIQKLKEEKYKEAFSLIWENLPLPGVLGRICPHPCEKECNRKDLDEPIAICELKRFLADQVKTEISIQKDEIKKVVYSLK
jgi:NADPH-dependent glutamate synthase beta subunit-like oxidoreductase